MTQIFAVINQKGGVLKTSITRNVAARLALLEHRVLAVDFDPQGTLTTVSGFNTWEIDPSVTQVIMDDLPISKVIRPLSDMLHIAPADIHLASAEFQLPSEFNREYRLKNSLAEVAGNYDFILIDCPPSLGILNVNTLAAADSLLIPMSCDFEALMSVRILYTTIMSVRKKINPSLRILGLLRTKFKTNQIVSTQVSQKAEDLYGEHMRVFKTIIRNNTAFEQAALHQQSIYEYAPGNYGVEDYNNLVEEILNG